MHENRARANLTIIKIHFINKTMEVPWQPSFYSACGDRKYGREEALKLVPKSAARSVRSAPRNIPSTPARYRGERVEKSEGPAER